MKHFLKILFLTSFVIFFDQWTKAYFFNQPDSYFIHKHLNYYFLFGSFRDAPPFIKYIFTAFSLSSYLVIFSLIDFLYLREQKIVQIGLWMLVAGVFGNYIDKVFYEGVRDFLHLIPNVYTNLADLFQWIGFSLFTIGIFKNNEEIWHRSNNRKKILVYPSEQLYFTGLITLSSLISSAALMITSTAFLKFIDVTKAQKEIYFITMISIVVFLTLSTFVFSFFLSSKIWGPIFSFKRHIANKNETLFKSRKTDIIQLLGENIANKKEAKCRK